MITQYDLTMRNVKGLQEINKYHFCFTNWGLNYNVDNRRELQHRNNELNIANKLTNKVADLQITASYIIKFFVNQRIRFYIDLLNH